MSSSFVFPGYPCLSRRRRRADSPAPRLPTGKRVRLVALTALANLCAQASRTDPARRGCHLGSRPIEFRDQTRRRAPGRRTPCWPMSMRPHGSTRLQTLDSFADGCVTDATVALLAGRVTGPRQSTRRRRRHDPLTQPMRTSRSGRPADFAGTLPERSGCPPPGLDGLFLASPTSWTLRSPSVDFAAAGLIPWPGRPARRGWLTVRAAGRVVRRSPRSAPGGLTLRRIGQRSRARGVLRHQSRD